MDLIPAGRVHDKDAVLNAYVGNGARDIEVRRIEEGYIFRGIIDHSDGCKVFAAKINIAKFGLAIIEEIIYDATLCINHNRKEAYSG